MIGVLVKIIILGIQVHGIASTIMHVKFHEYLDIENSSCQKRLFRKSVSACENELLTTVGKVTCKVTCALFTVFHW